MKKLLEKIFGNAEPGFPRPGVYNRNLLGRAAKLKPAPSYWALVPVKPQQMLPPGNKNPFRDQ